MVILETPEQIKEVFEAADVGYTLEGDDVTQNSVYVALNKALGLDDRKSV